MPTINETLARLKESKFRAKFYLTAKDKEYITNKGIDVIRSHAKEFVRNRLAPTNLPNDGKQTRQIG